jgi:hypothetical protein
VVLEWLRYWLWHSVDRLTQLEICPQPFSHSNSIAARESSSFVLRACALHCVGLAHYLAFATLYVGPSLVKPYSVSVYYYKVL